MFVIDYLKCSLSNRIVVPPFHSGHLGMLPNTADQHIALLQPAMSPAGCELCITPYSKDIRFLFRLKCVLQEKRGVVNKLLRAIAAMNINILSWESATLESNGGHGVFMLLDWSTAWPDKHALPKNLQNLFFPRLSGIIPSNDLRYIRLLRQILGQCADVLLWREAEHNIAVPRLRLSEFEETRVVATYGNMPINKATEARTRLEDAGVAFEIEPRVATEARLLTERDGGQPLHYILVSDIETKTLRIFIPRLGREKRMIHLGFSHKNLPGALCAITEFVAASELSIVSGLVRKMTDERNILEVTLEHDSREMSREDLARDPAGWTRRHLRLYESHVKDWLRYYEVALHHPLYPRDSPFEPLPLYDVNVRPPHAVTVITPELAESDVAAMAVRAGKDDFKPRRWLTDLLFAEEWGPQGKPTVFLSFPKAAKRQVALIERRLESRFKFIKLQAADVEEITQGAIERIVQAHCFIGVWHPEKTEGKDPSLSPWMPFEYGVARSHNKPCVILSHNSLPAYLVDRIERDKTRIPYTRLRAGMAALAELERRCDIWMAEHYRLSLTTTKSAESVGGRSVRDLRKDIACAPARNASDECAARGCAHERKAESEYCDCHLPLEVIGSA